jgi:hypothetical protein
MKPKEQFWFPADPLLETGYVLGPVLGPVPGNWQGDEYFPEIVLWMALCSKTAYSDPGSAARIFSAAGFDRVIVIERGDTLAYLAWHPNAGKPFAVLTFRGTESLNDAWVDARIFKRPAFSLGRRIHRGFCEAFGLIWNETKALQADAFTDRTVSIRHALSCMQESAGDFDLYLTGHSLGGALSELAAMHLVDCKKHPSPKAVINFGSPRVGNGKHARAIGQDLQIHRIVNGADTVPRKPPLLFGYRHAGAEYWMRRDGDDFSIEPSALLAKRLRWANLAYDKFYSFWLYLIVPLFFALLFTKFTYHSLALNLSPVHALSIGALIWILLLLIAIRLAPAAGSGTEYWLNRGLKSGTDHFIKSYLEQVGNRASKKPLTRKHEPESSA